MPSQSEIRQSVTNAIIAALKTGGLSPWRRPWSISSSALPTSLSSRKPYRGINCLLLQAAAMKYGYASKWFGTFKQIKTLGGSVQKGERGTQVVFFKECEKELTNDAGEDSVEHFWIMREFTVFNLDQTTGLERFVEKVSHLQNDPIEQYEMADAIIDAIGADIRFGGSQAFYSLENDYIQIPYRKHFETAEAFYETCFHELAHFSEHPTRLNWDRVNEGYAMGELIAELSSCLMMAELGLSVTDNLTNHAAYLQSWLSGMTVDPKFIFRAASQANKVADYLLSFNRTTIEASDTVSV